LSFAGRDALFLLVLVQLMIMPDVLIVENYPTMSRLGLLDTIFAMGLPYMASAFGIFLLRQTFKTVPTELDEAARVEGARPLTVGLQIFSSTDQGVDWSIITAATLLTSGPLLLAFLLFQRQFVQSFMRAGIR
jgi:sn-glycerol 3-phosphate transport system permease protein